VAVHWENQMVIDRPIDEIWAILIDLFNTPRLPGGSMALRLTSPGPMALGSIFEGRRIVLGFETRITERVIEWDPPNLMTASIETKVFHAVERITLVAGPDGTTCSDVLDAELRMPLRLIEPILEPFLKRQRRAGFRKTKEMLEAGFR
jgi:polyketide cyclase/dehydrase/lipid transport protein